MKGQNLCPNIETCGVTVDREDFLSTCAGEWEKCPLIAWKLPKKWRDELRVELEGRMGAG